MNFAQLRADFFDRFLEPYGESHSFSSTHFESNEQRLCPYFEMPPT